jgi:tetratricopeptide (TPR) repeat protein
MKLQKPFSWDENELKRLLVDNPKDSTSWYLLGRLYYKQNDNAEAIKCLERARKINPKNADAWLILGILCDAEARNRRDELKALRYMEKARELNPSNFEAILDASILNIALGNCARGAKILEEGLILPLKDNELCAFNQGLYYAHSKLGNQLKADTYLKNAKKLCDKHQEIFAKAFTEYLAERAKFFIN